MSGGESGKLKGYERRGAPRGRCKRGMNIDLDCGWRKWLLRRACRWYGVRYLSSWSGSEIGVTAGSVHFII